MRVLWTHNYPPNVVSAGIFMHSLLERMRRLGVDVEPYCLEGLRTAAGMARAVRGLRRHATGFDLVHAQYGSACAWVTSFAAGLKVLTLRGTDLFGIEQGSLKQQFHGRLGRWLTYRSLYSYQRLACVSRQMRDVVQRHDCRLSIEVIPDGIDLARFVPLSRHEARQRLGQGQNRRPWVLVSSVTSGNPVKRWPLAKASFDALQRDMPDVELRTATGVSHDEMPLWVNASDVVLLTSTHEGWPNIVKEALACNVPFVSTDVGDLREIASMTATCCVTEADPGALAAGMRQAIQGGRCGDLRRHVQAMELGRVAGQYVRLYHSLCGEQRRAA